MNADILNVLKKVGAIITNDHIVLTSGRHTAVYVNKDALYPHLEETDTVARAMAELFSQESIDVVVGPALGGIILAQIVARQLSPSLKEDIMAVYAEKVNDGLDFTRGYDKIVRGHQCLVVEDVTNTGGSAKKLVELVRKTGGQVVGVCVIANRAPELVTSEFFDAPFKAVIEFPAESWPADECSLCQEGRPVNTSVGHGKKFLQSQGKS